MSEAILFSFFFLLFDPSAEYSIAFFFCFNLISFSFPFSSHLFSFQCSPVYVSPFPFYSLHWKSFVVCFSEFSLNYTQFICLYGAIQKLKLFISTSIVSEDAHPLLYKSRELQTLAGVRRIKVLGGDMTSLRVQQRVIEDLIAYLQIMFMSMPSWEGIDLAMRMQEVP